MPNHANPTALSYPYDTNCDRHLTRTESDVLQGIGVAETPKGKVLATQPAR